MFILTCPGFQPNLLWLLPRYTSGNHLTLPTSTLTSPLYTSGYHLALPNSILTLPLYTFGDHLTDTFFPGLKMQKFTNFVILKKQQPETELTARVLKKRSKTYKRLKDLFLIGRKRTKCAHFRRGPLFSSCAEHKNRKTIISTYLVMWEAGGRKSARDWLSCLFFCCT